MAKRKGISKKTRFEVFKRDSFTCQYCGRSAPDVVLHADHIQPVSKDGEDDVLNLITSCVDCNAGKSDRLLSDDSVVKKQKAQLDELNERREQLEMMISWREGLNDLGDRELEAVSDAWSRVAQGYSLNDTGLLAAKKLLKKFGLNSVLDAIEKSVRYIEIENGKVTSDSVEYAWKKVGGICQIATMPEHKQQLIHIRNIAKKRAGSFWHYTTSSHVLTLLERCYQLGYEMETLKSLALDGLNYTALIEVLESWVSDAE
jgi:hypothetical protein